MAGAAGGCAVVTLVPCTPVDELGCWLDGPDEPNNVHLEAVLAGHVDGARLRQAVRAALRAHPLARARLARARGLQRRLMWEIAPRLEAAPIETVRWSTNEELEVMRQSMLARTPPLALTPVRIAHAVGPEHDVVLLNVHHAAMDGLSCLRLLRSIARRYAGHPDPVPADPLGLRIPPTGPERFRRAGRMPPTRIAADRAEPLPGYGFQRLVLPCRPRTEPAAGTVNDVLIVALATTIARWNATHGASADNLRITVPINARPAGSAEDPLGNLCRLTSIPIARRESPQRTLAEVAGQTARAKEHIGRQIDPVSAALAAPWAPVPVRARLVRLAHRLGARRFSDTSLVSNLGVLREPIEFLPHAPVRALWFSAPAPMPRGLSLGAITLGRELQLCFRYRLALFDEGAAVSFVELFRAVVSDIGDPRLTVRAET